MTYEELISTVTSIINDETIYKKGLTLTYTLHPKNYKVINETLFYKTNPPSVNPEISDEFEIIFDDLTVIIKKHLEE